ncbi:peptidoglycan recognition protein family protein [Lacunimicrobium album]
MTRWLTLAIFTLGSLTVAAGSTDSNTNTTTPQITHHQTYYHGVALLLQHHRSRRPMERSESRLKADFAHKPPVQERAWKHLVIHHTATETGSVEMIHKLHQQRKDASGNPWKGIGYHFVIGNGHGMDDGQIESTFRWEEQIQGAHAGNTEYNERGIGICLVGNFEKQPPTEKQLESLLSLMEALSKRYAIPTEKIVGHRDVKPTACPGKLFPWEKISTAMTQIAKN